MEFGYGLITCQRHPDDPRSDRELYAEAMAVAEEAEKLGFDWVWTSEHHFQDDAYMPSVMAVSAAIAAKTDRIKIGTGVTLAPFYSPLRLAEDAATVDLLSNGRFVLGLGLGWLDWEFDAFGIQRSHRVAALSESIRVCRAAWTGDVVSPQGVTVTPQPTASEGPPIWIGAMVEAAVRRAARIADGFMAAEPTPEEFATQVRWALDEREDSRAELSISGYWPVFVSESGDAWEQARQHVHYTAWKYEDSEGAKGRVGPLPRPPKLEPDAEETLRASAIYGTPAEVVDQVSELRAIAGDDFTFIARLYWPGMDRRLMAESTQLFATEVIPKLR